MRRWTFVVVCLLGDCAAPRASTDSITAWLRALPVATNPKLPVSWFADDLS